MKIVLCAALMLAAAPAAAQDLAPALDPVMLGQGQVLAAMNQGYADRAAARTKRHGRHASTASPKRRSSVRHAATPERGCGDLASLKSRLGSLSREDYMRYRACRGLRP